MFAPLKVDRDNAVFTVPKISNELTNHSNCIISNSQFLLEIWNDVIQLLDVLQRKSPSGKILVNDVPLDELRRVMPQIIKSNIKSSGKISKMAELLSGLEEFRHLFSGNKN